MRPRAATVRRWIRAPDSTAPWTACAMAAPIAVAGPAKATSAPGGVATQIASVAVPVAGPWWLSARTPASASAWALASVAVWTAATSAASLSGRRTTTKTLMVPTRGSGRGRRPAAASGWPMPTVATALAGPRSRRTPARTSAAVSIPITSLGSSAVARAISVRCASGSVRA